VVFVHKWQGGFFLEFCKLEIDVELYVPWGEVYGWIFISELRYISYSLVYSTKSPICLFTGLSGFLAMFSANSSNLSIFLNSGGGLNARFRILSMGHEQKAPKASHMLELMEVSI